MAEYSNSGVQTVESRQPVIFNESPVPCTKGFVRHRDGTGNFTLKGNTCNCTNAHYTVDFSANIAIPATGAARPISLAVALDGNTIPASVMTVTPVYVDTYFNVSCAVIADVWSGCCETVTIQNLSDQDILVKNANIIFER